MKQRSIFPRFYEWVSRAEERFIRGYRREIVGGARGRVLEVGAGNGLNFEHYAPGTRVVAVEPQEGMIERALPRVQDALVDVAIVRAAAEALPFRDGAFDTVVSSLVLCSVEDPGRTLAEAARVLTEDGEVRAFEHVRSDDPRVARWQDRLNRPYGWFAGGCNLNRDTVMRLRRAGFAVALRRLNYGPRLAPHVLAVARRP